MRILGKFWRIPWAEKLLLGRIWLLIAAVRITLRAGRFTRVKARLERWHTPIPRLVRTRLRPGRMARLVVIASHFVPGGRHCLTQAMVLEMLLLRRGYPAELEIGVAMEDGTRAGQRLSAHAWVRCDDQILIGGEEAPRFKQLTSPTP